VLVHGYHLGVDDAAIYVPAIKRAADPALYPFGGEFFLSHARFSLFPNLVGGSARLLGCPTDLAIFAWHAMGVFLLLWAAWSLACACFRSPRARWAAVVLLAATLSVPVAGTALVIMDPYLTARSLSTPATLFAVACYVSNRPKRALAWLAVAGLVHPQMCCYGAVFIACLAAGRLWRAAAPAPVSLAAVPTLFDFRPATGPAREALLARTYFFVYNWAWYEWAGVFAPLALLWWSGRARLKGATPVFRQLARALVPFGLAFTAAGIALSSSARFEGLARLQPMRAFHLLYAIFFVLLGGAVGEYLLKTAVWRWAALFIPLALGMWFMQAEAFPFSPHVELPGIRGRNPWTSAFFWIRENTPKDAVFALDPNYMRIAGEDQHGFRAVAERSVLADNVKDSGAVSLFPGLADDWKSQVQATTGWERFQAADFERLSRQFGVSWILTRNPSPPGLSCPYRNAGLAVCRL
jgi:hypothetical protein